MPLYQLVQPGANLVLWLGPPPAAQPPLKEYLVRPLSEIVEDNSPNLGLLELIQEQRRNKRAATTPRLCANRVF
ncbi:15459_t:CDS:2, partial [Acaulospora colombiana]